MNEPIKEEHEPVTAVVPSGVPTTTTKEHTPKPPVMSDAMVTEWPTATDDLPYNPSDNGDSRASGSERDRSAKRPRVYNDDVLYEVALAVKDTPQTYKEAVTCEEKDKWLGASDTEFEAHERNRTWTKVKR
ncbi:hypothetical protein PsorP6_009442 [Peronosclerospora sorghi]|uniref:Uncharacterized protein n=1 Tax=Peronosclerospora sorghi TaxID=230839 RepID=A0ACC0VXG7_9STRA|nr:hypothetical protein PsorP6_009442 [Peronosclerospora sorghi]